MGNLLTDGRDHLWSMGTGLAARRRYVRDCHGVRCGLPDFLTRVF